MAKIGAGSRRTSVPPTQEHLWGCCIRSGVGDAPGADLSRLPPRNPLCSRGHTARAPCAWPGALSFKALTRHGEWHFHISTWMENIGYTANTSEKIMILIEQNGAEYIIHGLFVDDIMYNNVTLVTCHISSHMLVQIGAAVHSEGRRPASLCCITKRRSCGSKKCRRL